MAETLKVTLMARIHQIPYLAHQYSMTLICPMIILGVVGQTLANHLRNLKTVDKFTVPPTVYR